MSVYVDEMMSCHTSKQWPYNQSCHLTADTIPELHAFAKRLCLRREWFQGVKPDRPLGGYVPHYDLTINKRGTALRMGAKAMTRLEAAAMFRLWRMTTQDNPKATRVNRELLKDAVEDATFSSQTERVMTTIIDAMRCGEDKGEFECPRCKGRLRWIGQKGGSRGAMIRAVCERGRDCISLMT